MKNLQIEIPDGYEIDNFDISSGNISFKKKEIPVLITDKIKSVKDLVGLEKESFYKTYGFFSKDEAAYKLLKILVNTLNEGWVPDWNNNKQNKYYPYFLMGDSSRFRYDSYDRWNSHSNVGSSLCFKSKELGIHATTYFLDVYKDFMVIE